MLQIIRQLPVPPAIYGCINDCFILDKTTVEDAQVRCNKLIYPDGTPIFKVKEGQSTTLQMEIQLFSLSLIEKRR